MTSEEINTIIRMFIDETNDISDGSHTFKEIYQHRTELVRAVMHILDAFIDVAYKPENRDKNPMRCWKSKIHSDGTSYQNWFIAGIGIEPGQQITYHVPMDMWHEFKVRELDVAPPYDGHTPNDVIERLRKYF